MRTDIKLFAVLVVAGAVAGTLAGPHFVGKGASGQQGSGGPPSSSPAGEQASAPAASAMPPAATFDPMFEPCAHCHQIGPGARNTTGPSLEGVVGRKAGTAPGYPFSDAMRASNLTWDEAALSRFIASPQSAVPGTRMAFGGLDDKVRIAALVAYIAKAGGS